jgi:Planctomycete extracellular
MRDIHRSATTWLARRTGRGSTARPPYRSHRRRLTLEPLESRALLSLTTWTVNSLGDTGTGSGTSGDLRYVITQADQTPGDNTINFAVTGTITLNSALPDLSNTTGLTDIEGPGASSLTVARSSAPGTLEFGIFTVDANVQAQLAGLTITGGYANLGNSGGIFNAGTLTVTNCTIDNNHSTSGGGIFNAGTLTLTNSTIDNNSIFNVGRHGSGRRALHLHVVGDDAAGRTAALHGHLPEHHVHGGRRRVRESVLPNSEPGPDLRPRSRFLRGELLHTQWHRHDHHRVIPVQLAHGSRRHPDLFRDHQWLDRGRDSSSRTLGADPSLDRRPHRTGAGLVAAGAAEGVIGSTTPPRTVPEVRRIERGSLYDTVDVCEPTRRLARRPAQAKDV